jgi:RNA polymerase sigma-70 factor (ECF subfamily)
MAVIAEGKERLAGRLQPGLDQVFANHKDLVFRAAYRITGNANDAEDILQTVFLRLARQERLAEINHLPSYLHRSAVNAALDLLRQKKDVQPLEREDGAEWPEAVSTDHGAESAEIRQWLQRALTRLKPRWAEMFVLRFVEERSNREIAQMMKTSAAVVAVVLHRTRTQLKKDYMAQTRGRL